jgi:hypothetical protein
MTTLDIRPELLQLTINISIRIVPLETLIRGMQLIPSARSINLEITIVIIRLIIMGIHTQLVGVTAVRNGGIQSNLSVLLMVDGADFESILVSADETGLLTTVAGGSRAHDGGLGKDAGSSVGVGAIFGVNGREL